MRKIVLIICLFLGISQTIHCQFWINNVSQNTWFWHAIKVTDSIQSVGKVRAPYYLIGAIDTAASKRDLNNKINSGIKDGLLRWNGSTYIPYSDTIGSYKGGTFFYGNFNISHSVDKSLNYNGGLNIYSKTSNNNISNISGNNTISTTSGNTLIQSSTGYNQLSSDSRYNQLYTYSGYNQLSTNTGYNDIYNFSGYNSLSSISGYNKIYTLNGSQNLRLGYYSDTSTVFLRTGQQQMFYGGIKKIELDPTTSTIYGSHFYKASIAIPDSELITKHYVDNNILNNNHNVGNGLVYHNGKIQLGDTTLNIGFQWNSPDNSGLDYFNLQLYDTATYGVNNRSQSTLEYHLEASKGNQKITNDAASDGGADLLISRGESYMMNFSRNANIYGIFGIYTDLDGNITKYIPSMEYGDNNHSLEVILDSIGLRYYNNYGLDTSLYTDKTFVTKDWVLYRLSHAISNFPSSGITSTDITNWNSAYSSSHSAVTLGIANGLSLSTQQLSLGTASSSTTGALTSTDWNTFNNKQPAGSYKLTNDSTLSSGYFTNYKATLKEPNLPSQIGNNWKYLRTSGTSKIWDQIYSASGTWTLPSYTDNGNGTVTIGSGEYILNTASDGSGTRNKYTVAGGTFTMTDGVKNYIVVDYNSGLPITYSTTNLSLINNRSVVIAYTIDRTGTTLHMLSWDSQGKALPEGILNRLIYTQRFQKESGLTLSDSTGLIVKISSGVLWYGATNATISSFKSGATNNYMYLYSYNGSTWTSSTITSYNNTQYQGASGLVTIGNNNYYTVNWIFRGAGNQQDAYILLGTSQYATIADAEASTTPSNTPPIINSHCIPVGRIIVQKNATTSTEINQIQTQYYLSPSASNHENLAGLLGGDATGHYHLNSTQYTNATNLITNSGLTFDGTTFRNPSTNIIGSTVDLLTLKNTTTTSYSRIKYKATGNTFMSGVANNAETTYGIPNRYYIADSTANAVRFSIDGAGNLFKGISDTIISKSVYRDMLSKMTAKSIADTVVVKDKNSLKYVTTVSIPYGTSIQAYSAGNPYSLTNTSALIHFSTTDPSITIPTSGTWKITACVYLEYDTCTFSTNSTYTFKLRRTNNTATDLSNSSTNNLYTGITTSLTQGLGSIQLPVIYYSTTNTSDIIQLWGNLSATPNSGSFRVRQAWINAEQIY